MKTDAWITIIMFSTTTVVVIINFTDNTNIILAAV
jgi:hypothetical protein